MANKFIVDQRRLREITRVLLKHQVQFGINPIKLRKIAEELGPTFVKAGQILSMRDDLIPLAYCEELKKLRLNVAYMPFKVVKEQIEKTTNKKVEEIFSSIDEHPLGSASIGQVHKATLLNGDQVVFKVMRPGIYKMVESDMRLLKTAINAQNLLPSSDSPIDINVLIDDVWEIIKEEMDFTKEVHNCKLFATMNKEFTYIGAPKIYDEYTCKEFYVMEYIDGVLINDTQKLKELGYDLHEIGEKLSNNFMVQIIQKGMFHADPHPGNILIRDGKIIWIDFGTVGLISKYDRTIYKRAIIAFINQDAYEMQNIILSFGVMDENLLDYSLLYSDIESMLFKYSGMNAGDVDMSVLLEELLRVIKHHPVVLPKGLTALARSIITIQGVLKEVDPTIDLITMFIGLMKEDILKDGDVAQKTFVNASRTINAVTKTAKIPSQVATLLDLGVKGRARVNLDIVNIEHLNKAVKNTGTKIAYSLVIGAFALALAIILAALLFAQNNIFITIFALIVAIITLVLIGGLLATLIIVAIGKQFRKKK